jgi:hypothetical protein
MTESIYAETLSAQEIFTHVLNFLRKQKVQSMYTAKGCEIPVCAYPVCAYRGKNDAMCAVGCLIADSEYNKKMESISVEDLVASKLLPARLIQHENLLTRLQNAHDNFLLDGSASFKSNEEREIELEEHLQYWENDMKLIAELRNLNYTEEKHEAH